MKSRLEGVGVPVSDIPIQPMGMAVLEGSMSPGHRRLMAKQSASASHLPPPKTSGGDSECLVNTDSAVSNLDDSTQISPSQHSPPPVPSIDLSNFVVTMSMASHSLQVMNRYPVSFPASTSI